MGITAKQWVAEAFGGPEVLALRDIELPDPGPGEVIIDVKAVGINPVDYKVIAGRDSPPLPLPLGFEVAGVVAALGPDTQLASGGGAVGDEVIAFRVTGGYASALLTSASNTFAKPASIGFAEAANLLLAGATAADMLRVVGVTADDTVVLHGGSGAVGVSVLQQVARIGARVVATASPNRFEVIRRHGGEPVAYGDGLEDRLRALAPDGYTVALDAVGTDEAVDTSLALVADRQRIVTVVTPARAQADGFRFIGGGQPESIAFRDGIRAELIAQAGSGDLDVPVARTFPFEDAPAALEFLIGGHPGGKLALVR